MLPNGYHPDRQNGIAVPVGGCWQRGADGGGPLVDMGVQVGRRGAE